MIDIPLKSVIRYHDSELQLPIMTSGAKNNAEMQATLPTLTSDMDKIERLLFKTYGMMPLYSEFYEGYRRTNLSDKLDKLYYQHQSFHPQRHNDVEQYVGRITALRFADLMPYVVIKSELDYPGTVSRYIYALAQMFTQVHSNYQTSILAPLIAREKASVCDWLIGNLHMCIARLTELLGRHHSVIGAYTYGPDLYFFCKDEVNFEALQNYGGHLRYVAFRAGGYEKGSTLNRAWLYDEQGEPILEGDSFEPKGLSERVRTYHFKRKLAALHE